MRAQRNTDAADLRELDALDAEEQRAVRRQQQAAPDAEFVADTGTLLQGTDPIRIVSAEEALRNAHASVQQQNLQQYAVSGDGADGNGATPSDGVPVDMIQPQPPRGKKSSLVAGKRKLSLATKVLSSFRGYAKQKPTPTRVPVVMATRPESPIPLPPTSHNQRTAKVSSPEHATQAAAAVFALKKKWKDYALRSVPAVHDHAHVSLAGVAETKGDVERAPEDDEYIDVEPYEDAFGSTTAHDNALDVLDNVVRCVFCVVPLCDGLFGIGWCALGMELFSPSFTERYTHINARIHNRSVVRHRGQLILIVNGPLDKKCCIHEILIGVVHVCRCSTTRAPTTTRSLCTA